jgi:hypothetical protein
VWQFQYQPTCPCIIVYCFVRLSITVSLWQKNKARSADKKHRNLVAPNNKTYRKLYKKINPSSIYSNNDQNEEKDHQGEKIYAQFSLKKVKRNGQFDRSKRMWQTIKFYLVLTRPNWQRSESIHEGYFCDPLKQG